MAFLSNIIRNITLKCSRLVAAQQPCATNFARYKSSKCLTITDICRMRIPPATNKDTNYKMNGSAPWIDPACCQNPCKDSFPRFDDIYYAPVDKRKRSYQQTWSECPKLYITDKKICCYDNYKYPKAKRRKFERKECGVPSWQLLMMMCRNKLTSRCAKIKWPGCGPCRSPPKCHKSRQSTCRRPCVPYPSFSECQRPPPRPRRPVECNCLHIGPFCLASVRASS